MIDDFQQSIARLEHLKTNYDLDNDIDRFCEWAELNAQLGDEIQETYGLVAFVEVYDDLEVENYTEAFENLGDYRENGVTTTISDLASL